MRSGDFELCVVGGQERLDRPEVEMRHAQVYQLALVNYGTLQSDCAVCIDGKWVGTWRVPARQNIIVEHPVEQTGKFTFFTLNSAEANAVNLRGDAFLGRVQAIFTPEKPPITEAPVKVAPAQGRVNFLPGPAAPSIKQAVGGTGLTGKSGQQYETAAAIVHDRNNQVIIELLLVPMAEFTGVPLNDNFSAPVERKSGRQGVPISWASRKPLVRVAGLLFRCVISLTCALVLAFTIEIMWPTPDRFMLWSSANDLSQEIKLLQSLQQTGAILPLEAALKDADHLQAISTKFNNDLYAADRVRLWIEVAGAFCVLMCIWTTARISQRIQSGG